jgi:hypothetical protein
MWDFFNTPPAPGTVGLGARILTVNGLNKNLIAGGPTDRGGDSDTIFYLGVGLAQPYKTGL